MKKILFGTFTLVSLVVSSYAGGVNVANIHDDFIKYEEAIFSIRRELIDASSYISDYERNTYSSVYEVSLDESNSISSVVNATEFEYLIDVNKKRAYNEIILRYIKFSVKSCSLIINRLDNIVGTKIRHPGLERSARKLTDVCLSINEKYK